MAELTERQSRALAYIREYAKRMNRGPSIREIGEHLGMSHPNNAQYVVDRLIELGELTAANVGGTAGRPRHLIIHPAEGLSIPLRGRVSCGKPTSRDDDTDDRLDLRAMFNRDDLVAFRAEGTSMIEAAISPGDYLIMRDDSEPASGQTVVAMVRGQMLCKKLRRRKGKIRLEPCNGALEPIDVDEADVTFLGVLHTVLRKL